MVTIKNNLHFIIVFCVCAMLFPSEVLGFQVTINISPTTLNLDNQGQWIQCNVELPAPYVFANIDPSMINLEGVTPEPFSSKAESSSFSCKFDRSAVVAVIKHLAPGLIELTLSGYLTDGITYFEGTDIITVTTKELLQYTITPLAGPNGSINPSEPVIVDSGSSQEFTAAPETGYQVDTWSVDGVTVQTGGNTFMLSNIQTNHTVSVTFKQLQYTIISSAGANGTISPVGSTAVNYGDDLAFTASPGTGYVVDTWSLDGGVAQSGGTTYTLSDIHAGHTVNVTFKQLQYTIISSAGANGFISPSDPVTVDSGSNQEFTAAPDTGYQVDTWSVNGVTVQIGGITFMLSDIQDDHTVHVTFRQMLSYSLGPIEFNDEQEFSSRILNNNSVNPDNPGLSRTHIARVVGQGPDPDGVMWMVNLKDIDPISSNYGQIVRAHVKGVFMKTESDEILIRFKYMFNTSGPGVRLDIYLSDSPLIWESDDPQFAEHNIKVAELYAPPWPRPGSAGSRRFGIFEKIVWTGNLNFTEGVYIALVLTEPAQSQISMAGNTAKIMNSSEDTSVMIDSWSPAVQCYGICLDINWDNFINEADFLTVISKLGIAAIDDQACLEGVFGRDGTIDGLDVVSWDWAMNMNNRLLNFCGVPLDSEGGAVITAASAFYEALLKQQLVDDLPGNLSDLLILGKRGESNAASKLKDRYYLFDNDGLFAGYSTPASDRCNIRLVKSPDGQLYLLNSETGLTTLDQPEKAIVPPGKVTNVNEPRYNKSAVVYVGIQSEDWSAYGRPVLDAAFDADYVYVVPVVVDPDGEESYTAAAQLLLLENENPPYQVTRLYDDPPLEFDNQYRDNLREIEIDSSGNLYVLNVHNLNESDILWKYGPDGTMERLDLGRPGSSSYLPTPACMYVSDASNMLYMASAKSNLDDAESAIIYGYFTDGALMRVRSATIYGMQHVSSITENPSTGSLWVAGFNMYDVPSYPNPFQPAFYYPFIAEVPAESNEVQSISLYDPAAHDLAFPMSIIWSSAN